MYCTLALEAWTNNGIFHAIYQNWTCILIDCCNDDVPENFDGFKDLVIETSRLYNELVTNISCPSHCHFTAVTSSTNVKDSRTSAVAVMFLLEIWGLHSVCEFDILSL